MRARAGDPPRTMPQKILAGRCADTQLRGELVEVKVDQVILSRQPMRAFAEALALGMRKTPVEVATAYDGFCVTDRDTLAAAANRAPESVAAEMSQAGILIARPGIGFPAPVHLERFGSPARLAVTDDPRLASLGGAGMLVLVVSSGQLGQALASASVLLRPLRSVQILLSGRMRPFVCARDVSLELVRRGVFDVVQRIEAQYHAPVVVEFAGPSARLLSVAERAVLCGIAPQVGASAALFVSDEKTEVFLRDQRRSKAHRTLMPDPGAPCDEVVSIDLATVDPLVADENGQVRPVRDLAGKPVGQVILGGDSGATLRDMLAAAMLLKSKRVPARLELIVAPPSRQVLEVLGQSGALVDLIATGARIIEPDRRVLTGDLYPAPPDQISLRTSDAEPRAAGTNPFVVASAETLAYAVATGNVGDPRSFKRPVRVTVPRMLPTDDVLVTRAGRVDATAPRRPPPALPTPAPTFKTGGTLQLIAAVPSPSTVPAADYALALGTLDEVRAAAVLATTDGRLRAVIAPFIPSGLVAVFAGAGILALSAEATTLRALKGQSTLVVPPIAAGTDAGQIPVTVGKSRTVLTWLALGAERTWTLAATSRPSPAASRGRPV
jgi:homoaconitase/3-isopropylmalate dehydratase large subunit